MNITRTFDIIDRITKDFPENIALASKVNKEWLKISTTDYANYINEFSSGLLEIGIKKGDKIITISNNRYEWNVADMGMSQIGAVHVPIYPTISKEEYEHIFIHSDAKLLIVSDKLLYEKVKNIAEKSENIQKVYSFNEIDGVEHWTQIIELGKKHLEKNNKEILKLKKSISPDDLASMIYTSGTTGLSKGVMLSHKNFLSNAMACLHVIDLKPGDKALSFLPLCHVFERMVNYVYQYLGISIYYAENLGTIGDNLREIKANCFAGVPRIIERFYDRIIAKGKDLTGVKRMIFFWAVNLGLRYEFKKNWWYKLKLKIARKLVFSKWKTALGEKLEIIIVGGAAAQVRLLKIFWAAGIPVLEGYGLTETSPVVAVNHIYEPGNIKFGTVGPALNNVNIKIEEDGEIMVKGPNLMLGYYKNDKLTAEVINKDGWFHTGDVGILEKGKFLKITDRKKEMFKTSAGKYIAPQIIENKFKESDMIEQLMVIGENEKFASALIAPNFDFLHSWGYQQKIHFRDNKELIKLPEILDLFQKEINKLNKSFGQIEQIKRFRLVCESWTADSGALSPTLKLKRRFIYEKYDSIIREIYSYQEGESGRGNLQK